MNGKTLHARELRIIVKLQDWITAKMTAATWECDRTKILYWHRKPPPGVSPYRILKSRVTCGLHASKTFVLLYEVYGGPRRPLTFVGLRGPPSLQNHLFYCIKRTEAHGSFSESASEPSPVTGAKCRGSNETAGGGGGSQRVHGARLPKYQATFRTRLTQ